MPVFPLQSQMLHFYSPEGIIDLESFRAVDVSRTLKLCLLQPLLSLLPCNCVSRKSNCPGYELTFRLPSPLRGIHSQMLFCFYFYWLVTYCSLILILFCSNLIHIINSNLASKQEYFNKMIFIVTKIKIDSKTKVASQVHFLDYRHLLSAHFPIS